VNSDGYWDEEFNVARRVGRFRVAALGRSLTLSGDSQTNCFTTIEQRVPGLEVYNLGLPQIGPAELALQAGHDLPRWQPNLVLVCISVTDDLTLPQSVASKYDWRSVCLLRWAAKLANRSTGPGVIGPDASLQNPAEAYERNLHDGVRRLAVCRKPLDRAVQTQWNASLGELERLIRRCRNREMSVALVLVPADFQVQPTLVTTLARRAGWETRALDVEQPQRRLARFAEQQGVACLDLLPYLRSMSEPAFETSGNELNAAGRQLAADTLAPWLQTRFASAIAARP
jgi:hypothetical protein